MGCVPAPSPLMVNVQPLAVGEALKVENARKLGVNEVFAESVKIYPDVQKNGMESG